MTLYRCMLDQSCAVNGRTINATNGTNPHFLLVNYFASTQDILKYSYYRSRKFLAVVC